MILNHLIFTAGMSLVMDERVAPQSCTSFHKSSSWDVVSLLKQPQSVTEKTSMKTEVVNETSLSILQVYEIRGQYAVKNISRLL